MSSKWVKKDDGIYREGELIATLNEAGIPVLVKGKENQKSMLTRFLNGFKVETEESDEPAAAVQIEDGPVITELPPAMDPGLGSKTPEFSAWVKKHKPTYAELCRLVPSIKHSERKNI